MARPRSKPAGTIDSAADEQALARAGDAAAQIGQQIAIVESTYSIDIPYQIDVYVSAIRQRAIESAQRLVEIGRLLIVMRERETRETFAAAIERAGLTIRFAQRAMQAAVKLQDRASLQKLGVSKALELVSEDDDTLDVLEGGGSVAGLKLDDIERMSVRELKAALRSEREERADEKAADEEIIRKKDERINKLSRRSTRSGAREQIATLLEDLDRYSVEAFTFIKQATDTLGAINTAYAEAGEAIDEEVQQRIEANVESVRNWYDRLITEAGE